MKVRIPVGATGDGRFTRGCAHRVVNDRNSAYDALPRVLPSPRQQMLLDEGLAHEDRVFEDLERTHGLVRLPGLPFDELVAETTLHMRKGVDLIVAGALPLASGRVGKPDLLVKVRSASRRAAWGYVPVDVKNHKGFEGSAAARSWSIGSIESPFPAVADAVESSGKPKLDDSLQLAHYWFILVESGWAPEGRPIGGVIDVDRLLVWHPLDEVIWKHEHPATGEKVDRSPLEIAEIEWGFRWDAVTRMLEGEAPLTEPIHHGECATCPWDDVCDDELNREQHISLIAGVNVDHVKRFGEIGVRTMSQLAGLDIETALVVQRGHTVVDFVSLRADAMVHPDPTDPVSVLTGKSKKKLEFLMAEGLTTVADVRRLDEKLCSMRSFAGIARRIDAARVRLHPDGLPHLPRDGERVVVPRADIEVDVDMENDDHVYMWGTYSALREPGAEGVVEPGYRAFHTLPGGFSDEAASFIAFWKWMHGVIEAANVAGLTAVFYCYTVAEQKKMREIATRWEGLESMPTIDEIDEFCASDNWVDLKELVEHLVWPTNGMGLKEVAPRAGFTWRAEDAGGDNSILWYREATTSPDPEVREARTRKLLEYNEDDVVATSVLRQWLDDGLRGRGFVFPNVSEYDDSYR